MFKINTSGPSILCLLVVRLVSIPLAMTSTAAPETGSSTEIALLKAEFFAEDEMIEINPMVRTNAINLVRGTYGPFEPSITALVCMQLLFPHIRARFCRASVY